MERHQIETTFKLSWFLLGIVVGVVITFALMTYARPSKTEWYCNIDSELLKGLPCTEDIHCGNTNEYCSQNTFICQPAGQGEGIPIPPLIKEECEDLGGVWKTREVCE